MGPMQELVARVTAMADRITELELAAQRGGGVSSDYLPRLFRATGTAESGIDATPRNVCVLTVPEQPVAGRVFAVASLRFDRSAAEGTWSPALFASAGVGTLGSLWPLIDDNAAEVTRSLTGAFDLPAETAVTITTVLFRSFGASTASTHADPIYNRVDALWTADV